MRVGGGATADLLDWQPPEIGAQLAPELIRASTLPARIAKAVSANLRGHDRDAVVEAMRAYLQDGMSRAMLDNYASEAKPHRITLERFIALISVTGGHDLLSLVCEPFGFVAVREKYRDIIELHLLEEHASEVEVRRIALGGKPRGRRA